MPTLAIYGHEEPIHKWLKTLSSEQIAELTSLEIRYRQLSALKERCLQSEISADWVEEHGGDRFWWWCLGLKGHE